MSILVVFTSVLPALADRKPDMRFSRSSCVMEILKPAKQYCRMPVAYRRYYYTAGGIEKDSAFSYPKPQLLLTKPKLNVPL